MTNTGKAFEELTAQVYTRLLALDQVCARVRRNVVIEGLAAEHQIDVVFDFTAGKIDYLTLIECKDWGRAVDQEKVFAFHCVLQDIPGQPRGIMVSRSGFQDGAHDYAERHGIKLFELRETCDADWEGCIREVNADLNLFCPRFRAVQIIPDLEWCRAEKARLGLPVLEVHSEFPPWDRLFRYESGEGCDIDALLNQHLPKSVCDWTPIRHEFPERLVVPIEGGPLPFLLAVAIEAEVSVELICQRITVKVDDLIAFCFTDVIEGKVRYLDRNGHPLLAPGERRVKPEHGAV